MRKDTNTNSNKIALKANLKLSAIILTFLAVFTLLFCLPIIGKNEVSEAFSLEEKVDDEFVEFYEKEIAGVPIISSMSKENKEGLKLQYGLTDKRLILLLILDDFGKRVGTPKDFAILTEMNDKQLFLYGKRLVDEYSKDLDEDKKTMLMAQFLALIKKK